MTPRAAFSFSTPAATSRRSAAAIALPSMMAALGMALLLGRGPQRGDARRHQRLDLGRVAGDADELDARLVPPHDPHAPAREAQPLRDHLLQGRVGRTILGDGPDPHLEGLSLRRLHQAVDAVAPCSWRHAGEHLQSAALGRRASRRSMSVLEPVVQVADHDILHRETEQQ